jgi:D-alanyl-D-alanine carboxypeptidase
LTPGARPDFLSPPVSYRARPLLLAALLGLTALVAPVVPASAADLPPCRYDDVMTRYTDYEDWSRTLVDTIYRVGDGYVPPDLRPVSDAGVSGGGLVRAFVIDDLRQLAAAASAAGAPFVVGSAYRSVASQVATYAMWETRVGPYWARLATARPGHSEHQLGLALDFQSPGGPQPWLGGDWGASPAGAWLAAHAWEYGFVLSYPAALSPGETCYKYEPWHFRYVGRATAAIIQERSVSLRAYLWASGNDPDSLPAPTPVATPTPTATPTSPPTPSPTLASTSPATPAPTNPGPSPLGDESSGAPSPASSPVSVPTPVVGVTAAFGAAAGLGAVGVALLVGRRRTQRSRPDRRREPAERR